MAAVISCCNHRSACYLQPPWCDLTYLGMPQHAGCTRQLMGSCLCLYYIIYIEGWSCLLQSHISCVIQLGFLTIAGRVPFHGFPSHLWLDLPVSSSNSWSYLCQYLLPQRGNLKDDRRKGDIPSVFCGQAIHIITPTLTRSQQILVSTGMETDSMFLPFKTSFTKFSNAHAHPALSSRRPFATSKRFVQTYPIFFVMRKWG